LPIVFQNIFSSLTGLLEICAHFNTSSEARLDIVEVALELRKLIMQAITQADLEIVDRSVIPARNSAPDPISDIAITLFAALRR
jgi:hypothetical protein